MKLIVAIIRPEKLEAVQNALAERDVYLMTVSDVRGCGRQRGFTEVYRGTEVQIRLVPKLKSSEIAVNEAFTLKRLWKPSCMPREPETPGPSATAKSSCCLSKTASVSAQANVAGGSDWTVKYFNTSVPRLAMAGLSCYTLSH